VLLSATCWTPACVESEPDPCNDSPPPVIELPDDLDQDAPLLADLTVEEWVVSTPGSGEDEGAMLTAHFADFSDYDDELVDAIPFGEACVGIAGQHVINERPTMLTVDRVVFEGIPGGDEPLEMNDAGLFAPRIVSHQLFSASGGEVVIGRISSSPGEESFPKFRIEGTVPRIIEGATALVSTARDLELEWEPADSSFFEILVTTRSEDPNLPPNRLRCLTVDDGCAVIEAAALEWVLSGGAESVTLRLERHALAHLAARNDSLAELDLTRSYEFEFDVE